MAKLGSFVRALVLTVGLWGLYYWLDTIHDGSLGAIAEFVKVLASLCSIVVAAALFVGAMALLRPRGKTRARRASSSAGMLPHAAAPSIAMANTELDPARQPVVRLGPLASGGAALAFFAYFPVARYFQILTPIRFWVVVMALSAVGAILVHVLYIRRRLLQFAKRSDRLGTAVMPAIFIIPCLAIVLRLLNAPADLFVPHQTQTAVVTHTSVWGGRNSWASCFTDVTFDSGASLSLRVPCRKLSHLPVGMTVKVQIRAGLLGMPWCLDDCLTPMEQNQPLSTQ